MDKKEFKRRPYVRPWAEAIKVNADAQIMAVSPNAGLSPSIEKPKKDDDEEIFGQQSQSYYYIGSN